MALADGIVSRRRNSAASIRKFGRNYAFLMQRERRYSDISVAS
jgi:hypothetical protein